MTKRILVVVATTAVVSAALAATITGIMLADDGDSSSATAGGETQLLIPASVERHLRVLTDKGPVHVWLPHNFKQASAHTVVYVHGFGTPVDVAWREHQLAAQFRTSRRNAMFIVPGTRTHAHDPIKWTSLAQLIRTVREKTGVSVGGNRVIAVGHSGAFRTIEMWLGHPALDRIVLLDGLYGAVEAYAAWLRRPGKRMVITAVDTVRQSEVLRGRVTYRELPRIPDNADVMDTRTDEAQLIYMRSQYSHMGIVTSGKVIPVFLAWVDLDPV